MIKENVMKDPVKAREREQRELTRRIVQRDKPKGRFYALLVFLVVVLIHVVDEITSNVSGYVQSSIVTEFFVNGMGMSYNDGLATMSSFTIVTGLTALISPFYKTLSDKYGRKPFLVFNTFCFGVGLFICFLAPNYWVYLIGVTVTTFFTGHDMQVLYVLEAAPSKYRTTFYGITKCIGTPGLVLVPLFRDHFMGNDPTKWRLVFLMCVLPVMLAVIVSFLFSRETDVFLDQRIRYLETPAEARKQEKDAAESKSRQKSGIPGAVKYILHQNGDIKWLFLANIIFYIAASGFSSYYESLMYTNGMQTSEITQALYVYPFVFAAIIGISGFVGDHFGRRRVVSIMNIGAVLGFILFLFACRNHWTPLMVGALYGIYLGCYWTASDYMMVMASEKAPTALRASVMATLNLLYILSMGLGLITVIFLMSILPLSSACLIITVPFVLVSELILLTKVSDTRGADLNAVGKEADPAEN